MKLPFPPRFFPSSPEPLENRIAPAVINPIDLTTLNGADGFRLNGQNGSHAGFSTASAGDVTGDGFEDVIVGAYFGGIGYGAAYVVFGRANGSPAASDLAALDGSSGFIITGNASGGRFGSSVSGAGDLNGDGFDDLIVSARRDPGNGNNSGAAFVVFGHAGGFANLDVATLNGSNGFKLGGANPEDAAGSMVSGAGDVNGDGFADLLVSALGVNAGGSSGGAAYVVFGKANGFAANLPLASLDGGNGFRLTGIMANDFVGTSLAAVGDVNGDGFGDILIGATGADPNGSRSGAAYLVFGKANGFAPSLSLSALNGANGAVFRGVAANDIAGVSVGGAGDLNGDGLADFVIGASGANAAGAYSGAAYVIYGKTAAFAPAVELSGLDGTTGFRLGGESAADSAGYSVSLAGDINGDGLDDLVVGAINAEIGAPGQSGAYVLYGKTGGFGANMSLGSIDGQNGFKLTSGGPFSSTGTAVGAGDVNGDGYDDVIVGARFGNGSMPGSGAAYVVFGFSSGSVTREGGAGADMLNGTAGADIFVSGQLNDTAQGAGGADVFHGGQGDDLFTIGDGGFGRVDGGRGTDTLKFGGGFALDLTALRDGKLTGIEKIDLVGGAGSLTLDLREVLHLSDTANTLVVRSDSDDVVNIGAGWIPGATEIIDGETFSIFTQGAATLKLGGPAAAVTLVSPSVATFTDVDGDLVTIKVNKGTLGLADFVVVPRGSVGGLQLLAVNFSDDGAEFQDANLTISAVRGPLGGDGGVNVGLIQATGVDLGKVGVEGDLGVVFAGDAALATPGLDALSVRSIGLLGTSTQSFGGSAISRVEGKLGTLAVATDMVDHQFNARAVPGGIAYGAIKVGGSIRGSTAF
ncbi:MAG: integrin alpha, partial [Verrucomicrobiota bacterium]